MAGADCNCFYHDKPKKTYAPRHWSLRRFRAEDMVHSERCKLQTLTLLCLLPWSGHDCEVVNACTAVPANIIQPTGPLQKDITQSV